MNYTLNQLSKFNQFYKDILKENIQILPENSSDSIGYYKKGNKIHIKKLNRGKFTEYCEGNVTDTCILKGKNSPDPKIRKRATFAANARTWKHLTGGRINRNLNLNEYNRLSDSAKQRYAPFTNPKTKQTTYFYSGPAEKGLEIVSPEFLVLTMGRQAQGLKLGKAFSDWRKLRNKNFNLDKSIEASNGKEAFRNFATQLIAVLNPLF